MALDDEIRGSIRDTIHSLIYTLANEESLREYASRLGRGTIGEVYCQWFDDLYHPDDELFRSAFSPAVLEAFDRLNAALLSCRDSVAGRDPDAVMRAQWWRPVPCAAQEALRLMDG